MRPPAERLFNMTSGGASLAADLRARERVDAELKTDRQRSCVSPDSPPTMRAGRPSRDLRPRTAAQGAQRATAFDSRSVKAL